MVKNLPANTGDTGSIPGPGRSPGEGNGNALPSCCLEIAMDRGAWRATIYKVAKVGHDLGITTTTELNYNIRFPYNLSRMPLVYKAHQDGRIQSQVCLTLSCHTGFKLCHIHRTPLSILVLGVKASFWCWFVKPFPTRAVWLLTKHETGRMIKMRQKTKRITEKSKHCFSKSLINPKECIHIYVYMYNWITLQYSRN